MIRIADHVVQMPDLTYVELDRIVAIGPMRLIARPCQGRQIDPPRFWEQCVVFDIHFVEREKDGYSLTIELCDWLPTSQSENIVIKDITSVAGKAIEYQKIHSDYRQIVDLWIERTRPSNT